MIINIIIFIIIIVFIIIFMNFFIMIIIIIIIIIIIDQWVNEAEDLWEQQEVQHLQALRQSVQRLQRWTDTF